MKRTIVWASVLYFLAAPGVALASQAADEVEHAPAHAATGTLGTVRLDGQPKPAGEARHEEGAAEEEEHEPTWADINWADFSKHKPTPYVVVVINVAILAWLLTKLLKRPVMDGLKERREHVAKEIEDAARIKKEAAARAKKYQARLDNLDAELEGTHASLVSAGEADKERILREAKEKAERMDRDAKLLLEQELRQRQIDLKHETVELAVAAAEELLKKQVSASDQERLAEEFLAQLALPGRKGAPVAATGGES